ncbi:site-specific integrase [Saccharopolyspora sp. ASAGF58]|uniref:tyrosine-type recombinase/integrase n=1 Tax=Saccharopolyspora sp. ASAGF58 TaxID=2719023 RepID=UPI001B307292|nr:site-specific integrase [Saccharopolyspora sp. ASAGF58]
MGTVHRLDVPRSGPKLGGAVDVFLAEVSNRNTTRAYATALRALVDELGAAIPVTALDDEATVEKIGRWFARRWGNSAAATVNARLDALRSATAWWRQQEWISGEPTRRIRRRPRTPDRTRAVARADIESLLTRQHLPLRERALWRMLYETAARAEEILALDLDELDLRNRCAKVRRKGGAADVIVWRTATARLLPRLLNGRKTGPVFLTDRRARIELPSVDLDPESGRARLSYRRAAETFEHASKDLTGGPWTLHQLRHSALTHAAEDGANTSTLLSYSGHTSVASLARYARVSPEALARWQQGRDPAARRR